MLESSTSCLACSPLEDVRGAIVALYASTIRPVIEYPCPVYGLMMTASQAEDIEKMQQRVLKIVYGYKVSYKKALEISKLPTMAARRQSISERFTNRVAANPKWSGWFPENPHKNYQLREVMKYKEEI